MNATEQLKELAKGASNLYQPVWKVRDYALSDNTTKRDFEITPMMYQLTNDGEFFIVQDCKTFEIDRMSAMSLIDEELDLGCFLGKMNNFLSAYNDILDDDIGIKDIPKSDMGIDECAGFKAKYEWYGTGGSSYFSTLTEAHEYIAHRVANHFKSTGNTNVLDCVPFDMREKYPELLV